LRVRDQTREAAETCAGVELSQCAEVFNMVVRTLKMAFNRMMKHDEEELQRSLDLVRHSAVRMSEGRLRWRMNEYERQTRGDALLKWMADIQSDKAGSGLRGGR